MASNDVTKQQSELIDKALEDAAAAEAKCEKLEAENERLKNKYEPANGVIIDEMLELFDNMSRSMLHIRLFAGEKLTMALVPRTGHVPNRPNWIFMPPVQDNPDHVLDISGHGTHEFSVSPNAGEDYYHHCIVQFDQNGLQVTTKTQDTEWGASQLVIEKYIPPPPVVLATTDPGLETLYEVELLGTAAITFMNAIITRKQLILEFVPKPGAGDNWYFLPDGQDCQRKVFNGYGLYEVMFNVGKACLVDFKPGAVRIMERGAENTLAIRRPEMQPLVDIDEPDVPVGKRARTGQ
jgi:hypothetical protein